MYKKIKIESKISNLRFIENVIEEATNSIGISQDNYGKILVSTLEAVNNALLHGNHLNPEKFVEVVIKFESNELKIRITDEGTGFEPDKVPDPTITENLEAVNGRGLYIMSRLADNIKYNKKGNVVTITFKDILS